MLKKYKPIIITLSIIALIAFGIVDYVKHLIDQPIESIPEYLQLKAPVEKILNSRNIKNQDNNDIVKYLYVSETEVSAKTIKADEQEIKEDIRKRTKNAQIFPKGNNEFVGRFYAGEPFYKNAGNDKWYQTETATTTAEEFSKQTKPNFLARVKAFFGMDVLADSGDYYAGAGDGAIYKVDSSSAGIQVTWDQAHDAATGSVAYPTSGNTSFYIYRVTDGFGGYTFYIWRAFFPIDTSSLGVEADITSATLYVHLDNKLNSTGDGYIVVVQTSQADTTTLTTADYNQCGSVDNPPTQGSATVDITDITNGQYQGLLLNETGRIWINKEGITKLGIREGHDCVDEYPANDFDINGFTSAGANGMFFSEQDGTDNDPYLEVTYTTPATAKTQINSPITNKFTSGLVGNWSFNGQDMDWASTTAEALDRSGQGNNGNVIGAKAVIGKVGQGLELDGVDDYIDCGNVYDGIKTVSFWIKANSLTEKIIDLNGTADIEVVSGTITANNFSSTIYVDGALGSTIDTEWHYISIATSTGINASAVDIGRIGADYFNGILDEVRIYNYILSAEEILKHYQVWSRTMKIDPAKPYKTIIQP